MLADPLAFLEKTTAAFGGVAGLVLGGEFIVLVSDPEVAKDVLIDRASIFVKVCTHPLWPSVNSHSNAQKCYPRTSYPAPT